MVNKACYFAPDENYVLCNMCAETNKKRNVDAAMALALVKREGDMERFVPQLSNEVIPGSPKGNRKPTGWEKRRQTEAKNAMKEGVTPKAGQSGDYFVD